MSTQTDLPAKLHQDMVAAMKSGQKDRLQVIRMLLSDVKNVDLLPGKPTPQAVVEAYAKKLRKSAEEYQKLGKTDEVKQLQFEITVVDEYLPTKASAEETDRLVEQFLAGKPFTPQQIGPATGAFMKAHGSEVDAALASTAIRKRLSGG